MNIIALCSALDKSYLALEYDNKTYSKIINSDENYHSLYLISEIKKIFEQNKLDFKKLDAITVNSGPGSFTGIRVAMSIAKIMAGELNLPLVTLNTAEILLNTYKYNKLIMDARRDMLFVATLNDIKLVLKNDLDKYINKNDKILTDKNCFGFLDNTECFEDKNENIANTMIELAKHKLNSSTNKDEFNYLNASANYIQTPPVF
jgi:tRNA threonylcarbamoyl adenosine modification protein YeaZ